MSQKLNREEVVSYNSSLELLGFLKANGIQCRFVSMTIKTPVVKIRVDNPWGAGEKTKRGLYKISKKIGIINMRFANAVQRRIAEHLGVKISEVEYEPGQTWYHHLTTPAGKLLPVVVHNTNPGEFYLQYFPQVEKSVNQYVNDAGEPVDAELVKPWLYKESPRSQFKPAVISVNLRNIVRLKASGVVVEMPALEEVQAVLNDD